MSPRLEEIRDVLHEPVSSLARYVSRKCFCSYGVIWHSFSRCRDKSGRIRVVLVRGKGAIIRHQRMLSAGRLDDAHSTAGQDRNVLSLLPDSRGRAFCSFKMYTGVVQRSIEMMPISRRKLRAQT